MFSVAERGAAFTAHARIPVFTTDSTHDIAKTEIMDKKSANGFPSKASESGVQRKQLPYSVETPYGFHLDLDFLKYVDDIEKGNTIKRVHIQRKNRGPKYSTLPRNFSLPGHSARPLAKDTWANTSTLGSKPKSRVTEVQQLFEFRASDATCSSTSTIGSTAAIQSKMTGSSYATSPKTMEKFQIQTSSQNEQSMSLNVRPHLLRASSMPVNVPRRKGSDSTDEQSSQSQNGSSEKLFRPADGGDRRGSVPQDRASLHQQITAALKRVRELEEQVRTIPELRSQICSLRMEREQLLQRIQQQETEQKRPLQSNESEVPQNDTQVSAVAPVISEKKDTPSLFTGSADHVVHSDKTPEQRSEQHPVVQVILEQESEKNKPVTDTESEKEQVPAPVSVPVILIDKAETPTDPDEEEGVFQEEASKSLSEQEEKQERSEILLQDKESTLSQGISELDQSVVLSECTSTQEDTTTVERPSVILIEENTVSQSAEEKLANNLELEAKLKTLEESLSKASCELEKTNALLREQMDENRQKDERIQELIDQVKEQKMQSIVKTEALSEPLVTCDASISTDIKSVLEKGVSTEPQPAEGPKDSSTQTNLVEARDIEVLAQVTTAEKIVGVEVVMCDQAMETDFQDNLNYRSQEVSEMIEKTDSVKDKEQESDMTDSVSSLIIDTKVSETVVAESDTEEYVMVESAMVETMASEDEVPKPTVQEEESVESPGTESTVTDKAKGERRSSLQAQQEPRQTQVQDPQSQPQKASEATASPAAIGQVVNRIQGLLNEQWASLGSGGQDAKGESSQKPHSSKISSIQSHLRGSLSALSAFYSPVQKGGTARQSGLKSIMKKNDCPDKQGNGGAKKNLKFVGVNGGYESTSSEDSSGEEEKQEEVEEVDSSEPEVEQGEEESGTAQEEAAAAGEQGEGVQAEAAEGSEEPDVGTVAVSPQEEQPISELVDKNFMAACHFLKDRMAEVAAPNKDMRQVLMVLYQEWFRVSSQKESQADTVTLYLREVGFHTPTLLRYIVNLADGNGNMALHYSVSHSNFSVVKLLLDTGLCEVDHQNKAGYTAIMLAALTATENPEDMEVAHQLLRMGKINARASQSGQTALMLAVSHGRTMMVQVLLDCEADLNIQDRDGSTALMCACEHGHTEIAKILLERPECDVTLTDKDGHNALSIAMKSSHSEIIDLLKARCDPATLTDPTAPL